MSYDINVAGNQRTGADDRLDPACANRLRLATAAIAEVERDDHYCEPMMMRMNGNYTFWHKACIESADDDENNNNNARLEEMLQRKLIVRCSGPHSVVD